MKTSLPKLQAEIAGARLGLVSAAPIVLASESPRRKWLLGELGVSFVVESPEVNEPSAKEFPDPQAYVQWCAFLKARAVSQRSAHRGSLVLAADTVAVVNNVILGKPTDRNHARQTLQQLQGQAHETMTGVCVCMPTRGFCLLTVEITHVFMRTLSEPELEEYLDSEQWRGKAGAYGIQEADDPFVESIDGSFSNVVGLPVGKVTELLNWAWSDCSRMGTM